jgi:hypothetical protein
MTEPDERSEPGLGAPGGSTGDTPPAGSSRSDPAAGLSAGSSRAVGVSLGSAAPSRAGAARPGPAISLGGDWPEQVAGRLEGAVGTLRDKTTVPVTKVARAVVFGLVIAVGAALVFLFLVVAFVRLLDVYLPFHPYGRRVWVVDAGIGAIFLLAGSFCWSKRSPKKPSSSEEDTK